MGDMSRSSIAWSLWNIRRNGDWLVVGGWWLVVGGWWLWIGDLRYCARKYEVQESKLPVVLRSALLSLKPREALR